MIKRRKHQLGDLIAKSEAQKISEEEQQLLDDFVQKQFDTARWNSQDMGNKEIVAAHIYQNLGIKKTKIHARPYYKYAVAAMFILLLSLGIILKSEKSTEQMLSFDTKSVSDSIKLPDGSVVYLAAHSSLKYPQHFNGSLRSVSLQKGNAFFKVTKDPKHPFVISSNGIQTKVLGTSFHISLQKDECRVTVVTGKVKVSSGSQEVDLIPNEEAIFSHSSLKKQGANDAFLFNWYQKDVELSNVSVRKVLTLLNYKYGVCFNAEKEEILNTRMTIYIKAELSLQNILDQINYITHLKFNMHDKKIDVTL